MERGTIQVICGDGRGKTASAIGQGIIEVSHHKKVIIIQFLKGEMEEYATEILKRLEPDMKLFRFERAQGHFESLTGEQKREEQINILNGFNFAKKVMTTGECDVLILDEILGLVDQCLVTAEELIGLLNCGDKKIDVILTGRVCPPEICGCADTISRVENIKVDNFRE